MKQSDSMIHLKRHVLLLTFIAWLSMIGFDFLLHAGLLAGLYNQPSPFLLPPSTAFGVICGVVAMQKGWKSSAALHIFINTIATVMGMVVGLE